jgi:tetratricopeptide (TPR) repeat protein
VRRRGKLLGLVAGAAVLVAAAVAFGVLRPRPKRPPALELAGLEPEAAAAIGAARAEVEAHPGSADAWGRLGRLLFAFDLQTEGLTCLEEAERLDPTEVRWPYYQGMILLLRRPGEALAPLRRAVERGGGEFAPWLRLAEALLAQDQLDEAEPLFRQVQEAYDDNLRARALLGLGQVAYRRGELAESLPYLRRAADSPVAQRAARAALAEVDQRLGDAAGAEAERRRVADLPPDPQWPDPFLREAETLQTALPARLAQADRVLAQGQVHEAADLFRAVLRDHPESDRAHLEMARVLIRLNDLGAAETDLREALRLNPQSIDGHFLMGAVYGLRKDDGKAEASFRRVVALKPAHALAHYNIGLCRLRQKDPAGAAEAFRAALRSQPNMTDAHVALAEVLLAEGQAAEARAHLEDALRLAPENEKARRLLAKVNAAGK